MIRMIKDTTKGVIRGLFSEEIEIIGAVNNLVCNDMRDIVGALNAALLVLHAPRDEIVAIDNASQIFLAAKHPKGFVTLDSADHLITRSEDAEYAADVIATWARRYIALKPPAPPPTTPG